MNNETRRPARLPSDAPARVRHLVQMHEQTQLRLVCLAGIIHRQSDPARDYAESFHDAAAQILRACLEAGSLTPDTSHEHTGNLVHVDFQTGKAVSGDIPGSSKPLGSGFCSISITADAEPDAAFHKLARAHGFTWSQAFSFAAAWFIPAGIVQAFENTEDER